MVLQRNITGESVHGSFEHIGTVQKDGYVWHFYMHSYIEYIIEG